MHSFKPAPLTGHIGSINQARAVAAVMVALDHCLSVVAPVAGYVPVPGIWEASGWQNALIFFLNASFFNGQLAVRFFFVLSGFVLVLAFEKHPSAPQAQPYVKFLIQRFFRLVPAHMVVLACVPLILAVCAGFLLKGSAVWTLVPMPWPLEWTEYLNTLLARTTTYNHVVWTLRYEFFATLYILPLIWLMYRIPLKFALALGLVLVGLDAVKSSSFNFLNYMYMFYFGVLAGYHRNHPAFHKLGQYPAGTVLAVLFIAASALSLALPSDNATMAYTHIIKLGHAIIAAIALIVLCRMYGASTWFGRTLVFLGKISYSFYLIHYTAMFVAYGLLLKVMPLAFVASHPFMAHTALFILSVGPSVGLAALSFAKIESPAVRLGRKLTQSH